MKVPVAVLAGACCLVVGGCAGNQPSRPASSASNTNPTAVFLGSATTVSNPAPRVVKRFSGIPMPPNNALDLDRTVVVGGENEWVGRVFFTTPMTVDEVVDFYRREMPRYGWAELAATRSTTSVLAYQADARVATVQVTGEGLPSGSRVEFWMNPRPAGGGSAILQTAEPGPQPPSLSPVRGASGTYVTGPAARLPVDQAPLPPSR